MHTTALLRLARSLALTLIPVAGLGGCTLGATDGAPPLAARCAEAAAALEDCGGALPDGFLDACEFEPTDETIAVIDDLAATQCDAKAVGGKADGLGETLFVTACTPVMHAGYLTNRYRNGSGRRLRPAERDRLRPFFGRLVDQVTVHYNANINTRWSVAGHELQYGNYTAQSYGNDLYIVAPHRPGNDRQLALVAHEMHHTRQIRRAGGLRAGLKNYCRAHHEAGYRYEDNALEVEAYGVQRHVLRCLRGGDNCP
jgi:hypothetical protein